MARGKRNGNGRLEEAMALMLQNVATLAQTQTAFVARMAETDARVAEMDRINAERFARIESILMEHSRILAEHSRILSEHTRLFEELAAQFETEWGSNHPRSPPRRNVARPI